MHVRLRPRSDLALLLLTGAAFCLRLAVPAPGSVSSDEAVYLALTRAAQADPLALEVRAHPPLLPLLLGGSGLGHDEASARMAMVVLAVAVVPLAYVMVRPRGGRRAGLLAASLVALWPYHVRYSDAVMPDVPMATAVAVALCLLDRWQWRRERWAVVGVSIALALAVLFKESALVVVAAVVAALRLVAPLRPRRGEWLLGLSVATPILGLYPLWLWLRGWRGGAVEPWRRSVEFATWQIHRPANESWSFYLTRLDVLDGALVVGALAGAVLAWRRPDAMNRLLSLVLLCAATFFMMWPVKGPTYLMVLVLPAALLCAQALREVAGVVPMVGVALVCAAVPTSYVASSRTWGAPSLRETGSWLASGPPGCVSAGSPAVANVLSYYGRRTVTSSLPIEAAVRNPAWPPSNECVDLVVWDAWTAREYPAQALALTRAARARGDVVVHSVTAPTAGVQVPVVIVFQSRTSS